MVPSFLLVYLASYESLGGAVHEQGLAQYITINGLQLPPRRWMVLPGEYTRVWPERVGHPPCLWWRYPVSKSHSLPLDITHKHADATQPVLHLHRLQSAPIS